MMKIYTCRYHNPSACLGAAGCKVTVTKGMSQRTYVSFDPKASWYFSCWSFDSMTVRYYLSYAEVGLRGECEVVLLADIVNATRSRRRIVNRNGRKA
jgi:hypothetical protein